MSALASTLPYALRPPRHGQRLAVLAWSPGAKLRLLVLLTLLARLLFASAMGLGIDESYMVAAGRELHLGYLDHPPVAWWLAWAAAHLAGTDAPFAVRLPFVLLFSLSTWLMYRLGRELFGARAGLWAACLLNVVPVLGVTAGSWVLPDGPLVAALLGAALCFVRAEQGEGGGWGWWLGCGACFGIALCSKYLAAPIGAGAVLYLLTQPRAREWLARPQPYAAAALALLLFSPVILWNARHGWASLGFQGGRAFGAKLHPFGPLVTLGGEALFFLPWIWVPLMGCVLGALRAGPAERGRWLLVCLSLPSVLLFELVSLDARVLFHWAAPATMMALPLLGDAVARRAGAVRARYCFAATALVVAVGAALVASEVRYNWLPELGEHFATGADPDLDAVDWDSLRAALAQRGMLDPATTVVAAIRWHDAAKIDYALHGAVPVICLGDDPRQYGFAAPPARYAGRDLLIVAPRQTLGAMRRAYADRFAAIEPRPPVVLEHAGRPAMELPIFVGRGFRPAG